MKALSTDNNIAIVNAKTDQPDALESYSRRELAGRAARIAAYGSADVRTPADWTWQEALENARMQDGNSQVARKKRRRYEKTAIVQDVATGPIFENEVSE